MPLTAFSGYARIALVFYRDSSQSGGSYRLGEMLARGLARLGHQVHVLFAYGGPGLFSRHEGIETHYLGARGPAHWNGWLRAREAFREMRPTVAHFLDPVVWMQAATLGLGIPKVLHMHRALLPRFVDCSHRLAWRAVAPSADVVAFISRASRDVYVRGRYGPADRTRVVRNAIDTAHFQNLPTKAAARQSLALSQNARILLMVGALSRSKGCFDALALLRRLSEEWRLVFCGDGPARQELEQQARGLRPRVVFLGTMDDTRPAYAASDAVLFLSHYESFGLFACQAMAAGVPVVGLRGLGEYEEPDYPLLTSQNSLLLPRRDLDALALRLDAFGADPGQWSTITGTARKWVEERFDSERFVREMLEVYAVAARNSRLRSPLGKLAEAP